MQESNPDARAPPGFRDRCLHHADLTFQRIVLAAGIEPEAGCERPGTAPAVSRERDGTPPRNCTAPRRLGGVGPDLPGGIDCTRRVSHPIRSV